MEKNNLSKKVKEIEMSKEMQERIITNCYMKMEENTMKTNILWKKPMLAVASFALCLCLTGITTLASTGKLQGFFKDIVGWNGAIIGTSYEQATDEIHLSVEVVSDKLTVLAEMVNPEVVPYMTFDSFGIEDYEIVDMNGKVLLHGKTTELVELMEGKATISIPINSLSSGNYKLVVSEFVGSSKADQPLVISGNWECEFSY